MDTLLYWTLWRWMPIRWRIRLENAWYWIADAHVWAPPDYETLITARTKIVLMGPPLRGKEE